MSNGESPLRFDQSAGIEHCESEPVTPSVTVGTVTANVPVVLAELNVKTNMVATITFPDPVLEIKDIKKRLKITQCRLLLPSDRLFLQGFVRKNIQYATPTGNVDSSSVVSEMRSFTIDIPFHCVTTITEYLTDPIRPQFNNRQEFDFFRAQSLGTGFPEKDQLLSSDLSQFHQESRQFYNPITHCELLSSHIVEWDEAIDRTSVLNGPFEEGVFQNVVEKMFLDFTIKVLQNQQIRVQSS